MPDFGHDPERWAPVPPTATDPLSVAGAVLVEQQEREQFLQETAPYRETRVQIEYGTIISVNTTSTPKRAQIGLEQPPARTVWAEWDDGRTLGSSQVGERWRVLHDPTRDAYIADGKLTH